jgi:hypothetical protein
MGFFDLIGDAVDSVGDALGSVGEAIVQTAVSTVVGVTETVADIGTGTVDVFSGKAFADGGWVENLGETVIGGIGDIADGSFLDKDGWGTEFFEGEIPFGGFVTAGFHEAAGNSDHAEAAVMHGIVRTLEFAGEMTAGRAGTLLAAGLIGAGTHMGTTVIGDVGGDTFLSADQQLEFADVSVGSMTAAFGVGAFSGVLGKQARDSVHSQRQLKDAADPSAGTIPGGGMSERAYTARYKRLRGQEQVDDFGEPLGDYIDQQFASGHFSADSFDETYAVDGFVAPQSSQGFQVAYSGEHDTSGDHVSWIADAVPYYQSSPGYEYFIDSDDEVIWAEPTDMFDMYGRPAVKGYADAWTNVEVDGETWTNVEVDSEDLTYVEHAGAVVEPPLSHTAKLDNAQEFLDQVALQEEMYAELSVRIEDSSITAAEIEAGLDAIDLIADSVEEMRPDAEVFLDEMVQEAGNVFEGDV